MFLGSILDYFGYIFNFSGHVHWISCTYVPMPRFPSWEHSTNFCSHVGNHGLTFTVFDSVILRQKNSVHGGGGKNKLLKRINAITTRTISYSNGRKQCFIELLHA